MWVEEPQPLTVRSGLGFGNAPDQNGGRRAVGHDVFFGGCLDWCQVGQLEHFPVQQLYHLFQQGASGETL